MMMTRAGSTHLGGEEKAMGTIWTDLTYKMGGPATYEEMDEGLGILGS